MRIRKDQLAAISASRRRSAVASRLRERGFAVAVDEPSQDLLVADAEKRTARMRFELDGRSTVTTAEGRSLSILPDSSGRTKEISDPAGAKIAFDYDDKNLATTIRRNGSTWMLKRGQTGLLQEVRYPDGTATRYDTVERGMKEIDRAGGVTEYAYGGQNGLLESLTDPAGNKTSYRYDDRGNANHITFPTGTAFDFDVTEDGMPERWRVNGQQHATFKYADDRPLMSVNYADGHRVGFLFAGERVVDARNNHSVLKLKYDDKGNLLEEDLNGRKVEYKYDKSGLLTAIVNPEKEELRFERDQEGRIGKVIDWSGKAIRLEYHKSGPIAKMHFPNGVQTEIACNAAGLDESIRTGSRAVLDPLVDVRYRYDACDRIVGMNSAGASRRYSYDGEGRLTAVDSDKPEWKELFELDRNGNAIRIGQTACTVNGLNQLMRFGDQELAYDALGNVSSAPTPRGQGNFTYNGQGQLTKITLANGSEIRYDYDPMGRRMRKTAGNVVTEYVWAGFTLLSEITNGRPAPFERRDHLFLPGSFLPLAMRLDGKVFYQHTDHRSACLALSDGNGKPVWQAEYSAFGRASVVRNDVDNPWRLMNHYYDAETGLHYNVCRYYHPQLGRYLSMDPLLTDGGSLNFYLYAGGDPINKADPTGQFIFVALVVGFVAGAVIAGIIEGFKQAGDPNKTFLQKAGAVAGKALIGGVVGAVGGVVGAGAVALLAPAAATAAAAGTASLSTLAAIGAVEGGTGAVAEVCFEAGLEGRSPTPAEVFWAAVIGTGVGAITAGFFGAWAARTARKAAQEGAQEGGEKLVREGLEEGTEKSARELADEAAEDAVRKSIADHNAAKKIAANGISPGHQRKLSKFAKEKNRIIVMRDGNVDAMKFQNKRGYTPKPVTCKAKTAKFGPDAGTVINPHHPNQAKYWDAAERLAKKEGDDAALQKIQKDRAKALKSWDEFKSKLDDPNSGYTVDPDGVVRLHGDKIAGDYDLHGVFDAKTKEQISYGSGTKGDPNVAVAAQRRRELNEALNPGSSKEMIQHGGQDDWIHPGKSPDPPATAFMPDGSQVTLNDADAMKAFYQENGLPWGYD